MRYHLRMKQLAILVSLLCAVVPVCAQSKNIHENVDPYTGLRTLFLEVSTRTCPGDPSRGTHDPDVHLLFTAMEDPDHTVSYFLAPELDDAGYTLNLRTRGTMDTLIDGTVGTLTTPAGSTTTNRYDVNHTYLHETIPFTLSPADLTRLSTAQWFQFRINGNRYAVQRCTDAKHLRDLAEFASAASEYGPPESVANTVPHPTPQPSNVPPPSSVPAPFVEHINPANQLRTLTLPNIPTQPCPGEANTKDAAVTLTISANQRQAGRVWFYVTTDIAGGSSLRVPRGGNIPVQIDGMPVSFHTIKGSVLNSGTDGTPHELTSFHVGREQIVALTNTTLFEFAVNGPTGPLHLCAQPAPFKHLTDFLRIAATYEPQHVAAATAPPL
jgi:hypothetical protein